MPKWPWHLPFHAVCRKLSDYSTFCWPSSAETDYGPSVTTWQHFWLQVWSTNTTVHVYNRFISFNMWVLLQSNLAQVIHIYVLLSPSIIILYWSKGGDAPQLAESTMYHIWSACRLPRDRDPSLTFVTGQPITLPYPWSSTFALPDWNFLHLCGQQHSMDIQS